MSFDEEYDRPPVVFVPAGEDDEQREENLEMVKPSPGYFTSSVLIADAIIKRSEVTVLDYTANQVTVRYQIDGIWHSGNPMDRETGDYMLATLKQLAGMDYRERRQRQTGNFGTEFQKAKQKARVVSQGVATGERVVIYLTWKKDVIDKVEDLGMRESMQEQLKQLLRFDEKGMMLVAGMSKEGYTSAWRGVLNACDRLTRDFYVIEEESLVEEEVINFGSVTFDSGKGETAMSPIPALMLREPNVLAFNDLPDGKSVDEICDLSNKYNMPVYVRAQGRNCIEAIRRVAKLKPDLGKFAKLLKFVVCMRTLRRLCPKCRIEYPPHPKLLQKLGLPVGRVASLYQPFIYRQGMLDEDEEEIQPCEHCSGIGYKGLTGIFELLTVTDELKKAIAQKADTKSLTKIAAANRHVSMRQEGAILVAKGETSVEELQRVLTAKPKSKAK